MSRCVDFPTAVLDSTVLLDVDENPESDGGVSSIHEEGEKETDSGDDPTDAGDGPFFTSGFDPIEARFTYIQL